MNVGINPENFFWCDLCDRISYDYQCECRSSYCNAGGCPECQKLRELVEMAYVVNDIPSEAEARKNSLKKFGSESPESKMMRKMFGNSKDMKTEEYKFDLTYSSCYKCPVCKFHMKAYTIYEMGERLFRLIPCECFNKLHQFHWWDEPNYETTH
jgi:hypothetical protein